ncbi:hypothetical protein FG05_35405 [Fusarium graminearum]|nr:hypothetical protein FG05_35405 [Fusarium graminearum]
MSQFNVCSLITINVMVKTMFN